MNRLSRCQPLLGTYVEVSLAADVDDDTLISWSQQAFAQIAGIERQMSFHDSASELSRINSAAHLKPFPLSAQMHEVLTLADELNHLSQGQFDVTIASQLVACGLLPNHGKRADPQASWKDVQIDNGTVFFDKPLSIDLGGIAKGYAVDRAFHWFEHAVDEPAELTVNAGGDMRTSLWQGQQVAIRLPSDNCLSVDVAMSHPAVASSAAYFLDGLSAIVSPKGRAVVEEKRSVTVFAEQCMQADALTKVVSLVDNPVPVLECFNARAAVIGCDNQLRWCE